MHVMLIGAFARCIDKATPWVHACSRLRPAMHVVYWLVVEQHVRLAGADGHMILRLDTNMFAPLRCKEVCLAPNLSLRRRDEDMRGERTQRQQACLRRIRHRYIDAFQS